MNDPQTWTQAKANIQTDSSAATEGETEAFVAQIAEEIVRRRLETPVVLFLESMRPLSFLGSQALHFLTPILGAVTSPNKISRLARLLETRDGVDRLLEAVEEAANKS